MRKQKTIKIIKGWIADNVRDEMAKRSLIEINLDSPHIAILDALPGARPKVCLTVEKCLELILNYLNLEWTIAKGSIELKKKTKAQPIFTGYSKKQVREKVLEAISVGKKFKEKK